MRSVKGYSLWLMPPSGISEHFQSLIANLSRKHETPLVQPHITLIGEVDESLETVLRKSEVLAASILPLKVALAGIGYQKDYFKALYVRIFPSAALEDAYGRAAEAFGLGRGHVHQPHLSLLYGDLALETKLEIEKEISREVAMNFEILRLDAVKTEGDVLAWRPMKSFGAD